MIFFDIPFIKKQNIDIKDLNNASGVKILDGYGKNHSLLDYSHTPNSIYAKLKYDGVTLHEMRFCDDKGFPIIEIAYHPEAKINNGDVTYSELYHFRTCGSGKTEDENIEKFLKAKIFDGKSLWEVENEIAWYDED